MNQQTNPIVLGLWPIAGVTTIGVTRRDAEATIATAIELGITTFDSAFSYGYEGESDRALSPFLKQDRDRFFVIGKVGQRWTASRERIVDGNPKSLVASAELSLKRLGIDRFDLLMLHSPDPNVPIEQSAAAIADLQQRGLCRTTGASNVTAAQRQAFAQVTNCDAIQCPLNLLQQDSLQHLIPDAAANQCDVYVYWTLMKGLLAGKITRDYQFPEGDSRPKYEVFQGNARERAHRIIDELTVIANEIDCTISQLSIGWAVSQPGVTAALVGAHRPDQIRETATAKRLPTEIIARINQIEASF